MANNSGFPPKVDRVEELSRALRESELRFKAVFHQAFGFRAILNLNGILLEVNEGVLEGTRVSREEVIGRPLWETPWWNRLPDEQERLKEAIASAARGIAVRDQPIYINGDGSERNGDRIFTPIRDAEGVVTYVGVEGRDITEQAMAGEALRRSEFRFEAIFNQTFGATGLLTPQGMLIDVNSAALTGVDLDREELVGVPFWRTPFWKDLPEQQERLKAAVEEAASGTTVRTELVYHDSSRTVRIADVSIKPFRSEDGFVEFLIAEGRDVTSQKRANEALREREAQLRTLVENAPEAMIVFDCDAEGFVDMNEKASRLFGYGHDEMLRLGPVDLSPEFQPDGQASEVAARARLERALAGETPAFEWVHLGPDGEEIPTEVRLVRLPAAGRRLVRGSITDISHRKRAEQERINLEQQLRQAQKMETVGQLAGGIAHDFNNLLLAILGYSELAMEGMERHDPRLEHLHETQKAAKRAANLTRKMLAFSRRQVIQPEYLDLNRSIPELESMLRRLIPESIEMAFTPGDDLPTVHTDPGQFEHVIVNLCINARDAMANSGKIEIKTGRVRLDADFCKTHPSAEPGDHALIEVRDTGCGISPEVMEHIFEPFFTTKPSSEGTGLGLAMVYGIVNQHRGVIEARSELGKGSSFRIYLPAVDHPATQRRKKAPKQPQLGTETVLVVEDEPMVRELAVRVLERAGYTVLQAQDGREAVATFEEHHDEIALVLLDVVMPHMGGREARDEIRKIAPEVQVLFTSGYSTDGVHSNFVLEPDVDILPKPYGPSRLLATIREALDGRPA